MLWYWIGNLRCEPRWPALCITGIVKCNALPFMKHYYSSRRSRATGEHKIRARVCLFIPAIESRDYLGYYHESRRALLEGRRRYALENGATLLQQPLPCRQALAASAQPRRNAIATILPRSGFETLLRKPAGEFARKCPRQLSGPSKPKALCTGVVANLGDSSGRRLSHPT